MATPDVVVNISGAAGNPPDNSDIGQAFAAVATQRGSVANPKLLQSLSDYGPFNGARQISSPGYDVTDEFFSEGGKKLYTSRVASATAAQATINLVDSGAAVSLIAKAGIQGDPDPGAWANGATGGLSVAVVVSAGAFQILTQLNGVQVDASPYFSTLADAIGYFSKFSNYIVLSAGPSSNLPVAAAAAPLAGGTDGAAIADADYQAALDRIGVEYGPGQIVAPGRVTNGGYLQVMAHAISHNRFALLDAPDTSNDATIEAAAQGVFGAPGLARRFTQMIGPWTMAPGLTTYTQRDIPPIAFLAALYARLGTNPNVNTSAAGINGQAQWIQDLSQPNFNSSQRDALAAATVTLARREFGGFLRVKGNRTLADPSLDANWSMAPGVRAIMWFAHRARLVGAAHEFLDLDPFGHELAAFKGDLMGEAKKLYDAGALWAPSGNPADAIVVDVGPSANPPAQLAQGIEVANVELRTSPTPDRTVINLVKVPMTQAV